MHRISVGVLIFHLLLELMHLNITYFRFPLFFSPGTREPLFHSMRQASHPTYHTSRGPADPRPLTILPTDSRRLKFWWCRSGLVSTSGHIRITSDHGGRKKKAYLSSIVLYCWQWRVLKSPRKRERGKNYGIVSTANPSFEAELPPLHH